MSDFKDLLNTMKEFDSQTDTVVESYMSEDSDMDDIAYELEEIKDQIIQLVDEAVQMIPRGAGEGGMARDRAEAYWYGHILQACGDERYPSGSTSIQSTIDEIRHGDDDGEDF